MTRYFIKFTKRAEDDAIKLDASILKRVTLAIETKLTTEPFTFGKPLGYSLHSTRTLRVGDWRVIHKISGDVVIVLTIRHRKQGYDDLM